ncbi:MAG: thioredoxin fold domain-containing protein [Gammaproteobacteria bacterium]|nr:thioredoxin fold domain-containing protein [Gammaproteobacteria bacterium]
MQSKPGCVFLLTLLLLSIFSLGHASTPGKVVGGIQSTHPKWFKESFLDIASDVAEADEVGKHLILFMHLNGCPYCYKMLEENFANAPYTQFIKDNFDVIVINIKGDRDVEFSETVAVTEKELAKAMKVSYTPTILFLDKTNKTVLRLNGYRSGPAFKHALDYVHHKAYLKTSLSEYIDTVQRKPVYKFRAHPQIKPITDLASETNRPLAILVEDRFCDACDALHDGHLKNKQTNDILKNFTVVRLDALSTEPIIDPAGKKTTVKDFVDSLDLTYRPGLLLFDKGKEIRRIDAMLYTYHFQETLRYVGEGHYVKYPTDFYEYLGQRTEAILQTGKDIDLSK